MAVELKEHLGAGLKTDPENPSVGQQYDVLVDTDTIATKASVDSLDTRLDTAESAITDHEDRITALESGGPTTVSVWMPEAWPASPHALDNDFDGNGPAGTVLDPDGYTAQSVVAAQQLLRITGTPSGSNRVAGTLWAVPAGGEFSIVVRASVIAASGEGEAGILLTNGTGSGAVINGLFRFYRPASTGQGVLAYRYDDYNSFHSLAGVDWSGREGPWLRLRVNGTTFHCDTGRDGKEWWCFLAGATTHTGFTPTHFGVGVDFTSGTEQTAEFECLRVFSGAGSSEINANKIGRLVSLGV